MDTSTLFHTLRRATRSSIDIAQIGAFRLLRISRLALATADDVVRDEVKAGRVGPVADKLKAQVRRVLAEKLTKRLVAVLLVRLGLRGMLASTVVGLLLPLVLEYAVRRLGQTQAWARITAREDVVSLKERVRARLRGYGGDGGAAPALEGRVTLRTMATPSKKRVQVFRSHAAMRDAMFADAARLSVVERWRAFLRLNRLTFDPQRPRGPKRVFSWQRAPGESEKEFQQRVEHDKFEWTCSRRKPLL